MNSSESDMKDQLNIFIKENSWLKEESILWENEIYNLKKELSSAWREAVLHSDVEQINILKKAVQELEMRNEELKDKICELQIWLW